MPSSTLLIVAFLSVCTTAFALPQQNRRRQGQAACPIIFDARVPVNAQLTDFDKNTSLFLEFGVFGQGLKFSDLLKFPTCSPPSPFEIPGKTKPVEVTISDKSIFVPGNVTANAQVGFRRAELNPRTDAVKSVTGVRTAHLSLSKDPARDLNQTFHEYLLAFNEASDFSTNLFEVKTGKLAGAAAGARTDQLVVQGNQNKAGGATTLFTTPFTTGDSHNFGIKMDFNANTIEVFFSKNTGALASTGPAQPNDNAKGGLFHFGVLKKPFGDGITNPAKDGFQEAGIDEGVVYGGIFEEDSANGCISLK